MHTMPTFFASSVLEAMLSLSFSLLLPLSLHSAHSRHNIFINENTLEQQQQPALKTTASKLKTNNSWKLNQQLKELLAPAAHSCRASKSKRERGRERESSWIWCLCCFCCCHFISGFAVVFVSYCFFFLFYFKWPLRLRRITKKHQQQEQQSAIAIWWHRTIDVEVECPYFDWFPGAATLTTATTVVSFFAS